MLSLVACVDTVAEIELPTGEGGGTGGGGVTGCGWPIPEDPKVSLISSSTEPFPDGEPNLIPLFPRSPLEFPREEKSAATSTTAKSKIPASEPPPPPPPSPLFSAI